MGGFRVQSSSRTFENFRALCKCTPHVIIQDVELYTDTLLRSNISPYQGTFKDDPFPQVGYVSSLTKGMDSIIQILAWHQTGSLGVPFAKIWHSTSGKQTCSNHTWKSWS